MRGGKTPDDVSTERIEAMMSGEMVQRARDESFTIMSLFREGSLNSQEKFLEQK